VHQSQICVNNNVENSIEVLLAEHCLSIRSPSELTVDNGKQFDNQDFRGLCNSNGMKAVFASVYHQQSNRVVERANGKIFSAIKKRLLDDKKGKWADQLPDVIWVLNTTEARAIGFTPFCLMYGPEAMTPQELKHGSP
jgi:transposase InsO family protein